MSIDIPQGLRQQFARLLDEHAIVLDETTRTHMLDYCALIRQWNKKTNLTRITDWQHMLTHHLLDSLLVIPYLTGKRYIDVGTGAGVPGIPLALAKPDLVIDLCECNSKKVRFLRHAAHQLKLKHTSVISQRVACVEPEVLYDGVLTRAFADLETIARECRHLLQPEGCIIAWKGMGEVASPTGFSLKTIELNVPAIGNHRQLVIMRLED